MSDRPLRGKALQRLFHEWRDDQSQRPLAEKGVTYEDQKRRPLDRAQDRDALLKETHRLHAEIGYAGFRLEYINDAAAIKEWPDATTRERELRAFWMSQAEQ